MSITRVLGPGSGHDHHRHSGVPPMLFRLAHTPILNRLLLYVTPRFLVRRNLEEVYGDPSRLADAVVDRYQGWRGSRVLADLSAGSGLSF